MTPDMGLMRSQRADVTFQERTVLLDGHRIYVRDYPGEGHPILLMHGFPDNMTGSGLSAANRVGLNLCAADEM